MRLLLILFLVTSAHSSLSPFDSSPESAVDPSAGSNDAHPAGEWSTANGSKLFAKNETNLSLTDQQTNVAKFPLYMRIVATLACLVILTVGVCGNLLVPLVVIKTKYLRNSTNLFLINLSVADLLVLIVCMPTVLIELHSRPETWLLGEPMCKYTFFNSFRLIQH